MLVREQDGLIRELVTFNHRMHSTMGDLHRRLSNVESSRAVAPYQHDVQAAGYRGVTDARSRSPSPTGRDYRDREAPLSAKKVRGRKTLQIQVPGKVYVPPGGGVGLPTPNTSFTVSSYPPLVADQQPNMNHRATYQCQRRRHL
jgi:hypothetical protein